jgi:hypothetical protein
MECGKGYIREPWMVNICSCEMLDFSVVKCDFFYSGEAWLSIKMLRELRIKDVCFVNCDFVLFISIYFIMVTIDIIRDNDLHDRYHSMITQE